MRFLQRHPRHLRLPSSASSPLTCPRDQARSNKLIRAPLDVFHALATLTAPALQHSSHQPKPALAPNNARSTAPAPAPLAQRALGLLARRTAARAVQHSRKAQPAAVEPALARLCDAVVCVCVCARCRAPCGQTGTAAGESGADRCARECCRA